jgi:TatA/E family protein of Tat protein translocase
VSAGIALLVFGPKKLPELGKSLGDGIRGFKAAMSGDDNPVKSDTPEETGDLSQARRCGAKRRRGTPCQCPAMANGRCRLHGGLSTGPKTLAGIAHIREALTEHGIYSKAAKADTLSVRTLLRESRKLLSRTSA